MSTGGFLNIHPSELKFRLEERKVTSCCMQLTSKTDQNVAFKVKTTNPKKYCVRPNAGIVEPGSTCNVTVMMQAQKEVPPDIQCKDKFLVQSVVAPSGITEKDITSEMFKKEEGKVVEVFKLRVVYILAKPPSHVPEGFEEGSSSRAPSVQENGNISAPMFDSVSRSLVDPKQKSTKGSTRLNLIDTLAGLYSRTVKLVEYVMWMVTMHAQKEAAPDIKCKDKFLLRSVVAASGITSKDIISKMFKKEGGRVVEEFKLRVIYISAKPPSPVLEGSEEGSSPRASVQDNGYISASMFDSVSRSLDDPKEKS